MTDFTASNGIKVRIDSPYLDIKYDGSGYHGVGGSSETQALREFFQHERDEELGRWRWPENPEYVVYLRNDGQACVFNEATGVTVYRFRGEHEHLEELRRQSGEEVMPHTHAARAYFEAHPERKPWHDAKRGEVWVLTIEGSEQVVSAVQQYEKDFNPISHPLYATFANGSERITDARKIWPEDAS